MMGETKQYEPGAYWAWGLPDTDDPEGWHPIVIEEDGFAYDTMKGSSGPQDPALLLIGPRLQKPGPPRLVGDMPKVDEADEYVIVIKPVTEVNEHG